jgi:hypothetical protein
VAHLGHRASLFGIGKSSPITCDVLSVVFSFPMDFGKASNNVGGPNKTILEATTLRVISVMGKWKTSH